jgi:uroporphyrinogen-III synthase
MKPLKGARILVTRPEHQADKLCQLINGQGGVAVQLPTLDIVAHDNKAAIEKKLANLDKFQWLVFISANAVNFALKANGGKIQGKTTPRIAAIGPSTAQALQLAGMPVDVMPAAPYNSEALLAMAQMQDIRGQSFLIVRGEGGREDLANSLRGRGAEVDYLQVYKRIIPSKDNNRHVLVLLATKSLDVITATSVETLQNLLAMVGVGAHQQLFAIPLVVISERIRGVAVEMGFERVAVTEYPSDAAMLETVTTYVTGGLEWPN